MANEVKLKRGKNAKILQSKIDFAEVKDKAKFAGFDDHTEDIDTGFKGLSLHTYYIYQLNNILNTADGMIDKSQEANARLVVEHINQENLNDFATSAFRLMNHLDPRKVVLKDYVALADRLGVPELVGNEDKIPYDAKSPQYALSKGLLAYVFGDRDKYEIYYPLSEEDFITIFDLSTEFDEKKNKLYWKKSGIDIQDARDVSQVIINLERQTDSKSLSESNKAAKKAVALLDFVEARLENCDEATKQAYKKIDKAHLIAVLTDEQNVGGSKKSSVFNVLKYLKDTVETIPAEAVFNSLNSLMVNLLTDEVESGESIQESMQKFTDLHADMKTRELAETTKSIQFIEKNIDKMGFTDDEKVVVLGLIAESKREVKYSVTYDNPEIKAKMDACEKVIQRTREVYEDHTGFVSELEKICPGATEVLARLGVDLSDKAIRDRTTVTALSYFIAPNPDTAAKHDLEMDGAVKKALETDDELFRIIRAAHEILITELKTEIQEKTEDGKKELSDEERRELVVNFFKSYDIDIDIEIEKATGIDGDKIISYGIVDASSEKNLVLKELDKRIDKNNSNCFEALKNIEIEKPAEHLSESEDKTDETKRSVAEVKEEAKTSEDASKSKLEEPTREEVKTGTPLVHEELKPETKKEEGKGKDTDRIVTFGADALRVHSYSEEMPAPTEVMKEEKPAEPAREEEKAETPPVHEESKPEEKPVESVHEESKPVEPIHRDPVVEIKLTSNDELIRTAQKRIKQRKRHKSYDRRRIRIGAILRANIGTILGLTAIGLIAASLFIPGGLIAGGFALGFTAPTMLAGAGLVLGTGALGALGVRMFGKNKRNFMAGYKLEDQLDIFHECSDEIVKLQQSILLNEKAKLTADAKREDYYDKLIEKDKAKIEKLKEKQQKAKSKFDKIRNDHADARVMEGRDGYDVRTREMEYRLKVQEGFEKVLNDEVDEFTVVKADGSTETLELTDDTFKEYVEKKRARLKAKEEERSSKKTDEHNYVTAHRADLEKVIEKKQQALHQAQKYTKEMSDDELSK